MSRTLDAHDVAAEFGRSADWLYGRWRELVAAKKLPPPIAEDGKLRWNAAQVYAVLDKPLTREARVYASAYRAALAAVSGTIDGVPADVVAEARARLRSTFCASDADQHPRELAADDEGDGRPRHLPVRPANA